MLRAAAAVGDARSAAEYRRLQSEGAVDSLGTLVPWANVYARAGRWKFSHFSDDMAVFRNALTFWLVAGPEDAEVLERIRAGLRAFWQFVKYSPNAYAAAIYSIVVEPDTQAIKLVQRSLRLFPADKRPIEPLGEEEGDQVQPIPNQRINSNYWKTNYFKRAVLLPDSHRGDREYAGQDFLVAYWMARAFGVL